MRIPDRWFIRELQNTIDKRYYVQYDPEMDRFDVLGKINGEDILLACFDELNAKALTELRYRKWLGRRFVNRKERERHLDEPDVEAKARGHEDNLDLIVHGYMQMYEHSKKKHFS